MRPRTFYPVSTISDETCALCGKNIRAHYGGAVKRCDPIEDAITPGAGPFVGAAIAQHAKPDPLLAELGEAALAWIAADKACDDAAGVVIWAKSKMDDAIVAARQAPSGEVVDDEVADRRHTRAIADRVIQYDNANAWLATQAAAEQRADARVRIAAARLYADRVYGRDASAARKCDGEHAEPPCGDPFCWRRSRPIAGMDGDRDATKGGAS